jgi:hypothetical protein
MIETGSASSQRQADVDRLVKEHFVHGLMFVSLIATAAAAQHLDAPPNGSAAQRDLYERSQASQIAFEQKLFYEAGFEPLAALEEQKRSVRRAVFEPPYAMLSLPGIEIERSADGRTTLTVIGRAGRSASTALPRSVWTRLTSLQGALLRRRPYVAWRPSPAGARLPSPPPVCHGWQVRFGAVDRSGSGSGSWSECGGGRGAAMNYAVAIARLAVSTRPACKFDEEKPFWSYATCFEPA